MKPIIVHFWSTKKCKTGSKQQSYEKIYSYCKFNKDALAVILYALRKKEEKFQFNKIRRAPRKLKFIVERAENFVSFEQVKRF